MQVLQETGLSYSSYAEMDAEEQFRLRLELAKAGQLKPTDHVKSIEGQPAIEMFEIRWAVPGGVEVLPSGDRREITVHIRLLYVEPAFRSCAVGLYAFEKRVDGTKREVREAQDVEISFAVKIYADEYGARWGVSELRSPAT